MHTSAAPSIAPPTSARMTVFMEAGDCDLPGVLIPRAEVHLTVRVGPCAQGGLDLHVVGGRQNVHRKVLRGGQRVITARLPLGTVKAVLGIHASEVCGQVVALEDFWGVASTQRLVNKFANTRLPREATDVLESAISKRLLATGARQTNPHAQLVLKAAARLPNASVNAVAAELGLSERHLRRIFREIIGVGPKRFVQLTRFRRALNAAHKDSYANWARIASGAGYYDQAHLISDFRTIAGVTPQALLGELRAARVVAG